MIKFLQNLKLMLQSDLQIVLLLSISFLFCACNGSYPPIEADDFGFPKYTIYAKGQNVTGEESNQLADWELSGYKYNGGNMVIMVYNPFGTSYVWGPWLCNGDEDLCQNMQTATYCIEASDCTDPSNCPCTGEYCYVPPTPPPTCSYGSEFCPMTTTNSFCCDGDATSCADVMYETFPSAPCLLQQGQGLYMLITNTTPAIESTYGNNPNTYPNVNRLPSSASFYTQGLWYPSGAYQNNAPAMGYYGDLKNSSMPSGTNASDFTNGYAYFKILDRYYDDNSGYFYVSLKEGFDQIVPPPIQTVISFLTTALDTTAQTIYTRIVNETEYRTAIKILVVMYIAVHGIMYLGGLTGMSARDLVSMSIRLIVVIQLLTSNASWELFNTYFFQFFTSGVNEMINIVTSNLPGAGEFSFFDSLLGLLFSYETNVKIYALIASFPCGILVTIMIYIAFAIFIVGIAQAVMIYLLAYMAIDLLIIVAPIFISFMLFEPTKTFFENWLNQFCSYFMQAVVVMAAISLFAQMIVDQIYLILGFQACYNDWITVNYSGTSFVIAKTWQICPFDSQMDKIAVPGYGYNNPDDPSQYCYPYECWDVRYVDLPFLDTDSEADLITAFQGTPPGTNGMNTLMLYNASILIIMSYLMMKFNDITPKLAKGLSGGSFSSAIGSVGQSFTKDIGAVASGFKNAALKVATGKSQAQREQALRMKAHMMRRQALTALTENIVAPTKQLAARAANYASGLAGGAASWIGGAATSSINYVGQGAVSAKDYTLQKMTGKTKQQRQYERKARTEKMAKNTSEFLDKYTPSTVAQRQAFIKEVKENFTVSKENQQIIKDAARSTAKFIKSTSMKAAGKIYHSGKAVAPKSIYSLAGFMKDMIIPPGSLMGGFAYNPEADAKYKKDFLAARNKVRARYAQEEKDTYDQFHQERKERVFAKELEPIKEEKEKLNKEYENTYSAQAQKLKRDLNEKEREALQAKFKDRFDKISATEAAIDNQYRKLYKTGFVERLEYDPKVEGKYRYEKSHRENLVALFKRNVKLGSMSIAEIEEKAAEFDRKQREEYGDSLSMAMFKAGVGGIAKATLSKQTLEKIEKTRKTMVEAIRETLQDPKIKKQKEQELKKQWDVYNQKLAQKEKRRKELEAKLKVQKAGIEQQKQLDKEKRAKDREARRAARYAAKQEAVRQKLIAMKKNVINSVKEKAIQDEMKAKGVGRELAEKFLDIKGRGDNLAQLGDQARKESLDKANKATGAFVGSKEFTEQMSARRKEADKHSVEGIGTASQAKDEPHITSTQDLHGKQFKISQKELSEAIQKRGKVDAQKLSDDIDAKRMAKKAQSDLGSELKAKFDKIKNKGAELSKGGDQAREDSQNRAAKNNKPSAFTVEIGNKAEEFKARSEQKAKDKAEHQAKMQNVFKEVPQKVQERETLRQKKEEEAKLERYKKTKEQIEGTAQWAMTSGEREDQEYKAAEAKVNERLKGKKLEWAVNREEEAKQKQENIRALFGDDTSSTSTKSEKSLFESDNTPLAQKTKEEKENLFKDDSIMPSKEPKDKGSSTPVANKTNKLKRTSVDKDLDPLSQKKDKE